MAELFFYFSLIFIFYAYFGYPLSLIILSFYKKIEIRKGDITPIVSFIISAYNEEKRIKEKIENTLIQDYPKDRLQIIVTSDASTDDTEKIVRSYKSLGVELVRAPERKGKENAQKCALKYAVGDIVVFSDAATRLDETGVKNIVKSFNDPSVGCVSSIDRYLDKNNEISGEGAYIKYLMFVRTLESKFNTLVGLSGSFFAVRKELCIPWATDLQSDFNTILNSVKAGYRGVIDLNTAGYYPGLLDGNKEFNRKVRTTVRGIRVVRRSMHVFNPFKFGFFSWQFFSHKICKWFVPFALPILFISNLLIIHLSVYYFIFFVLQLIFYFCAVIGFYSSSKKAIFKLPSFFIMANFSIILAWYKFLKGEEFVRWEPSDR